LAKNHAKTDRIKLALVGADTLLGRELENVLDNRGPGVAITSYASSGEGNFSEQEGEPVYLTALESKAIETDDAILVAGGLEGAQKAYRLAKDLGGRPSVIDCTGLLDQEPEARIVAPLVFQPETTESWLLVLAHPAASALTLVLGRIARRVKLRQSIGHIFEPASERGKQGVSELHQQTTSLLSFKPLDTHIFDAQLSFNLLSQYGEEAPSKLSTVEQRIERHVATLLSRHGASGIPMPSLRVVQAPVFHGYSISLWIECESEIDAAAIGEALGSAQIEVRAQTEDAPHSVGAASQSGLIVGDIRTDRNNPRAAWHWIVGDNLRLTADAATDLIATLPGAER